MATKFSNALISINSSNAAIQAWATFIDQLLTTTGGWINTTDTGQTATGSLVVPGAANTKVGFRIYHMNDALQATNPVFIRIDFGSGTAAANEVGIWLTIGTGSDGAGNITGTVLNSQQISNGTNASQVNNSYGSADVNRFVWALFVQGTNPTQLIHIVSLERSKDANGNDTSDGLILVYTNNAISVSSLNESQYLILAGGTQPAIENGLGIVLTGQNPTSTFSPGDVGVGVIIPFKGVAQQPGMNIVIANSNDVSPEGSFQMNLYGATRTYQQVRQQPTKQGYAGTADVNSRVCIRYD